MKNPVHESGIGAWQIGARLDVVDLNDRSADVRGGEQYSMILGVNWYLNDHIRMMLDGAWTRMLDARDSEAAATGSGNDIFGVGARARSTGDRRPLSWSVAGWPRPRRWRFLPAPAPWADDA